MGLACPQSVIITRLKTPGDSDVPEARIAGNVVFFRKAIDHIRNAAIRHEFSDRIPFLCECADERCTEIVRVSLADYEAVREHPERFLTAPDHHLAFADSVRRLEERDGYDVVERIDA